MHNRKAKAEQKYVILAHTVDAARNAHAHLAAGVSGRRDKLSSSQVLLKEAAKAEFEPTGRRERRRLGHIQPKMIFTMEFKTLLDKLQSYKTGPT